ncbi:MAG: thiol-disulfide oxidoreductase DCC family protein [Kiloniellaceae bacterium]
MAGAASGQALPPELSVPGQLMVFDGVCVLCSGAVRFILAHEKAPIFSFTPVQSDLGQRVLAALGRPLDGNDSVVVIDGGRCYLKSDAFVHLALALKAPWSWYALTRFCPPTWRDWAYDRLAQNRYAIFGRYDSCVLPDPAQLQRFPQ